MSTPAGTDSAADVSRLTQLNQDYIDAVKTSNVGRFQEILAEDFLCTTADGTLLDRAAFLEQAGRPTTVSALQAHDVNIRLVGDTAIVHAAKTFTHPDGRPVVAAIRIFGRGETGSGSPSRRSSCGKPVCTVVSREI
jgi:hypothetical protein